MWRLFLDTVSWRHVTASRWTNLNWKSGMNRWSETCVLSAILSTDGRDMLLIVIVDKFSITEIQKLSKSKYFSQIYRRLNFVLSGVDVAMVTKDTVWEICIFFTNLVYLIHRISVYHHLSWNRLLIKSLICRNYCTFLYKRWTYVPKKHINDRWGF